MAASITSQVAATVAAEVEALRGLNIEQLRIVWRRRLRTPPPPLRSGDLMRRTLAERIQLEAFGSDPELDRQIAALVRAYERGKTPGPAKARYRDGTVLTREYDGATHRVEVMADGFGWNGTTYRSLSAIATAITGVRWNGPKFFGLRSQP